MIRSILLLCLLSHAWANGLQWDTLPIESVLKKSRQDKKPILIFFHAPWCSYCHKMKESVFPNKRVREAMSFYHLVDVNGDDDGAGRKIFRKHQGSAFPTFLFLTFEGEEYDRAVGYFPRGSFISILKANQDQENSLLRLKKEIETLKGAEKAKKIYTYIEKAFEAGKFKIALELISKHLSDPLFQDKAFDLRLMRGMIYTKMKEYSKAKTYLKVAWDRAANEDQYMQAVRWLGRLYKKMGKKQKRLELYDAAVARYHSYQAYNGYAWYASQDGIELDRALNYAIQAVDLSGGKPGVLDTLAEVYYARGEYREALKVSREIILKDQESKTYQKRHKKYWRALKKTLKTIGTQEG